MQIIRICFSRICAYNSRTYDRAHDLEALTRTQETGKGPYQRPMLRTVDGYGAPETLSGPRTKDYMDVVLNSNIGDLASSIRFPCARPGASLRAWGFGHIPPNAALVLPLKAGV